MRNAAQSTKKNKNAPAGWHWGIGESSTGHYTYWLYSDQTFDLDAPEKRRRNDGAVEWGYEIQQYWDEGNQHTILANKTYYDEDGNIVHDERVKTEKEDTEERATQTTLRIAKALL